jgi:hypothetical protein
MAPICTASWAAIPPVFVTDLFTQRFSMGVFSYITTIDVSSQLAVARKYTLVIGRPITLMESIRAEESGRAGF